MNKYKKLVGNSIIFGIGNFGSKILLILLVPMYTHYLSAADYGTIDIITTTSTMLLPIISMSIYEAVLRFGMDKNESLQSVLTNALAITVIGILIALLIYPLLSYYNIFGGLLIYLYIILILEAFLSITAQYARAIGKVKIYAVNGIIKTLVLGISNVLLLVVFSQGIKGFFYSMIISNLISIAFYLIYTSVLKNIKLNKLNIKLTTNMLKYSIPLIPNSLMWWLMNASSRYFILFYRGVEVNGIFAASSKIPAILTIFTSIFSQAWQLSAIEEYNSESKSKFFNKIFNYYQAFLLIVTSAILVILKPLIKLAFAEEYILSWHYVPFLLLSVVFSSFSGFLGTNYIAAKETKGVFKTSVIGGCLSIILNIVLVPILGGVGAGISALISFLVIWILRVYDTKRYIDININVIKLVSSLFIISIQIIILFSKFNILVETGLLLLFFILLLISHGKIIFEMFRKGTRYLINR
ncbi:polysaccharide biosynthesis C-terminal domain-containing protein [Psychrobacillus psychrotolerans]|uniref:oligosaccharide flippase family protein n=1 Tax=Psychrobacillus psychrotolerans TaxID=126156 RepID=UPI003B013A17